MTLNVRITNSETLPVGSIILIAGTDEYLRYP
jgi:hypothetical protein